MRDGRISFAATRPTRSFTRNGGADSAALVIEKRDNTGDQIRFRWNMCCDDGVHDVLRMNRTDVDVRNANLNVHDRFFMPSRGYYFRIQRPDTNTEAGIQYRTGNSIEWYQFIDNDRSDTPSMRFLMAGQGFDDGNPQFRIDADGASRAAMSTWVATSRSRVA